MTTPDALPFSDTVALVTGGNRGIGAALIDALIARGARHVYLGSRDVTAAAEVAARHGTRVTVLPLDITDAAQVSAAAERAADVNLLINNAGVAHATDAPFASAEWRARAADEYAVNTLGTAAVTHAFAPVLARNGGGRVVNIASVAALVNFPLFTSYSTSKAGTHSLTQGTRIALAAQGTRVHGVYPGPVDTRMAEAVPFAKASATDVAAAILDGIAADAEEIFPDDMAEQLGGLYSASPKALERQVAAMAAA